MKQGRVRIIEIVLLVLAAVFFVGTLTFLAPCEPHEDGSFMTCHWAGRALTGAAGVLAALAVVLNVISNPDMKRGLAVSLVPVSALATLTPGTLIQLCMMDAMRCRAIMKPGALVFSVLIGALAIADAATVKSR